MGIEYLGLSEINGPLIVLEGVQDAFYEEMVEFVVEGNEISMKLQESLGLCKAKQKVYFMEKMLYNTSDL